MTSHPFIPGETRTTTELICIGNFWARFRGGDTLYKMYDYNFIITRGVYIYIKRRRVCFESNLFGTEVISLNDLDICSSMIIIPNKIFVYISSIFYFLDYLDYLGKKRKKSFY